MHLIVFANEKSCSWVYGSLMQHCMWHHTIAFISLHKLDPARWLGQIQQLFQPLYSQTTK